ncbi:hypothetical protein RB195_017689 [Necator americanus]|uniref:Galactosylgalactosylxylosylprotein 3-beta-glucuronosyltransferase n=2 Tax=Necator americanus TaxID=51031 RepID=A0ABR1C8P1_NECAM
MLIRLKPKALLAAQLFCGRLVAIIIVSAVIYTLVIAYRNEFMHSFRKREATKNARNVTIIVVTPTYKRKERIGDMLRKKPAHFRLSQTLSHIRNLHWIVVEDGNSTAEVIRRLLNRSNIPYVYLATTTAPGMPKRGWTQRNLALQYLRENYSPDTDGVLYFADDDNSYDVRLFDNYIRKVKRLGIWPVGLVGGAWVEAPRVDKKGKVEGWDVLFAPRREFATDMAGFGLHIKELFRVKNATFEKCTKTAGFGPESCFLTQFGFKKKDAEPFGLNEIPKDILVWHTKTSESRGSGPLRGFVIE